MSGLASQGEQKALGAILAGATVSLHIGDPGDSGGAEVTAPSYARVTATFTLSGANPTTGANATILTFNQAAEIWGTMAYFGVWSAGAFMGSGPLSPPKDVGPGDTPRFQAGALTVTAD